MADIVITDLGPLFTLDEVKAHLRVDTTDDDVIIGAYMAAAEKKALQYCNISLVPYGAEAEFKIAALLIVGDLYNNREGGPDGLPASAAFYLDPHRWLRV